MLVHPLFNALPEDSRRTLTQQARMVTLKKGEILAEVGQRCSDVFVVSNGKIRLDSGDADMERAATGFLTSLDIYVEDITVDSYAMQSTLVAVLNSTVQLVPLGLFRAIGAQHPELFIRALELVSIRAQSLRMQLRRLTTQDAEVVIGRALYELSDEGPGGLRVLNKRITQTALASYVGMSREQVNKKMREFELKGLIRRVDDGYELDAVFAHTNLLADSTAALELLAT